MDKNSGGYAVEGPWIPKWALSEWHSVDWTPRCMARRCYRSLMPRIADRNLDGVAFQYRTESEARQRVRLGGSSFLVGREISGSLEKVGDRHYAPYLVSNRHVVFDAGAPIASVNCLDGSEPKIWEIEHRDWHPHPDSSVDLAVACVQGFPDKAIHKMTFIPEHRFITPGLIHEKDVGVGDEVFMIGRFLNHQGKRENRPAVRFGNVSMMLDEFRMKMPDNTLSPQEGFSVEMRSKSGFSGSPVTVYRTIATTITDVPKGAEDFWALLGVNFGYVFDEEGENSWLNGVIPAWKISEALDTPAMKEKHLEIERRFDSYLVQLDTGGYGFAVGTSWIGDERKGKGEER